MVPADFQSGDVGGTRWRRVTALTLQAVGTVDARSGYFDQNLAGGGLWDRALFGCQPVGTTGFRDFDGCYQIGYLGMHGAISNLSLKRYLLRRLGSSGTF